MDSSYCIDGLTTTDKSRLGDYVIITKEIEENYGVFIDLHSEIPLAIGYGEVDLISSDSKKKIDPAWGGLCFSINAGYSYLDGELKKRLSAISIWGIIGHRPEISVFESPFSATQQHAPNHYGLGCYISATAETRVNEFFSEWSKNNGELELRGDIENQILYIYLEPTDETHIEIKLFSKKDYFTLAAWFILLAANKHFSGDEQAPTFEQYWPTCRYYNKPVSKTQRLDELNTNAKDGFLYSTYAEDLSKREAYSPLPFRRLLLQPVIGYYDENGESCFFGDSNIVNIFFGDGILRFNTLNDRVAERFDSIRDFSLSPGIIVVKGEGDNGLAITHLGDTQIKTDDKQIKKTRIVNAPYYQNAPIVLECRLYKLEGFIQPQFEAVVFKTHISESVCDKNGKLDLAKAWGEMTWEATAVQDGQAEE